MHSSLAVYGLLFSAVVFEVLGSSFLEKSQGLTHVFFLCFSLLFYGASFVLGAYILKMMPVGIMYAVWCGIGTVLAGLAGYFINHQRIDLPGMVGMGLVAAGVMVIYFFSKSVA